MAHSNNLSIQHYGDWVSIEDHRWRKNTSGMEDGQNGSLIIDDAVKAEGKHRVGGWIRSGLPVYRDEDNNVRFFTAEAKTAGQKCIGFLQSAHQIVDVNGEFYTGSIPVGVQTRGEVYYQWLPVDDFDPEDLPVRFTGTKL